MLSKLRDNNNVINFKTNKFRELSFESAELASEQRFHRIFWYTNSKFL